MCYASEYAGVDVIWQSVVNAEAGDQSNFLSNCLRELSLELTGASGAATMEEMERGIIEAGYTLDDCPEFP